MLASHIGEIFMASNYSLQIGEGNFYPGFNQVVANKMILIYIKQKLPIAVHTVINWSNE